MPEHVRSAAQNQPGALILIRPNEYIECHQGITPEPIICALGVSHGGAGKKPGLFLTVPFLDLGETVITKVLNVSWEERPKGHVLATVRLKASKPMCEGADSIIKTSTNVSFIRYVKGTFSTLLSLVEKSELKDGRTRIYESVEWGWHTAHPTPEKRAKVLAVASTNTKYEEARDSDEDATRSEHCFVSVVIYKFNPKADKLVEVKGAERTNILESDELEEYAKADKGKCKGP
jgi:hypothetical protein